MKFMIVSLAFIGCASAGLLPTFNQFEQAPVQQQFGVDATAPVLKSDSNINPDGSYSYEYQTGNGIYVRESGVGGKQVQGSVSYTGQDGQPIEFTYVADENGFQPTGSHLPTPPPIPEAIVRSLKYIAEHPAPAEQQQQFASQPQPQFQQFQEIQPPHF